MKKFNLITASLLALGLTACSSEQSDNYTLVQVNEGQYMLNDQPDQITMDQTDLRVRFSYNCEDLKSRIQ